MGLFSNENEFRNYLANNLNVIEPDLTRLKVEYGLDNPDGAGGRVDILARDALDHVVCIEIKRNDHSARETLNELSKYVTLLVERDRVPREMIRCVVISTDWHELLLPLSYFAISGGVDVSAFVAHVVEGRLILSPQLLKPLRFLPQLNPDFDQNWFVDALTRDRYVCVIRERAAELPFVRIALLLFDAKGPLTGRHMPFGMIAAVWRIAERYDPAIEQTIGMPIGSEYPYAAPGWEAESDAKNWIMDVEHASFPEVADGWGHARAETVLALLDRFLLRRVERVGDWPRLEYINDDAHILQQLLSVSPLGGSERPNRHDFQASASPRIESSWRKAVDSFLAFISFEPVWHIRAKAFLQNLRGDVRVDMHASDKRHLLYVLHQARYHKNSSYSRFTIAVYSDGVLTSGLEGSYTWDGLTCPPDAEAAINEIYGSAVFAALNFYSAVIDRRYEQAIPLHGFKPVVDLFQNGTLSVGIPSKRLSTRDFALSNRSYTIRLSDALTRNAMLPSDRSGLEPIDEI